MIRFLCPGCEKKLTVGDDKGGKVGTCPSCKTRFQIPEADPPVEERSEQRVTTESSSKRRSTRPSEDDAPVQRRRLASDDDAAPPRRRPAPRDDDDDDIPDAEIDAPRRKKKKKKRRRSSSESSGLPLGLDYFWLALIGLLVLGLPIIGLSLIFPPAALAGLALGGLASFVGGIWFLMIAFQDDATQGILCLLIPMYSLIYLISNFEETKRPFCLQMAGTAISVFAICAGGAMAGGPA